MSLPGLALSASQKLFFDSEAVTSQLSKADRSVNSKAGAYVMTAARRSMRKVNKNGDPAKPNKPPNERLGHLKRGRYGVQFGWDPSTRSVVIGPEVFPGLKDRNPGGTMPEALEKGGDLIVAEAMKKDGTYSVRAMVWANANGTRTRERIVRLEPRPFMVPAMRKTLPKLPKLWENALNKI